jgi:hypothetical protein
MANRKKAIKMASSGASVKNIRQATGVNAQTARNIASRVASTASPYNASNTTISSAPPTAGPLASGYVPLPDTTNTTTTQPTNPYKDIKSIRQGLAIGANNTISNKEAMKIAKGTGKSFDKVLAKGLGLGFNVGASAANKSNKRYSSVWRPDPNSFYGMQFANTDPLAAMRNQKVNKGYSYQGVAVEGGPGIFGRKNAGGMNPLTIKKPGSGDEGSTETVPTVEEVIPQLEDPIIEDPIIEDPESKTTGPGMLSGGGAAFGGAAGLRRKKSYLRSLGIRGMGQLSRGQINNMYKQTINLNR